MKLPPPCSDTLNRQSPSIRLAELARVGLIRTDGSELIAEAVCFPTELEGHPAVQMIFRDATARHALRDTEMLFDTAFETSVAGMAIIDINGKYLKVNRALSELLGKCVWLLPSKARAKTPSA
jgi:PAS domain-containing protein